jgi:feruloyl-CoA synthase
MEPELDIEERDDGSLVLRHPRPPQPVTRSMAHLLLERAATWPDRTLVAEKSDDDWRHLSYAEAVGGCRRVAQWLLNRGAGPDRPLAILSGASIEHFLMAWGAVFARVPSTPVSLSYSHVPGARPKLQAVLDRVQPGFLFADDWSDYAPALEDIGRAGDNEVRIGVGGAVSMEEILSTEPTAEVDESIAAITPDTVTRYMFTSGSTGMPKGVIVNHRMTCQMLASGAAMKNPLAPEAAPRVLDWMPWSHVGAGVMRLATMINAGGSVYLDDGKPTPGEFHKTIANLREVKPTSFAGAPLGWSMLTDALERDDDLARSFYENVQAMQAGSAAMPDSLADRIQALNLKYAGRRFPFGTSLMSTEVHSCTTKYWPTERTDIVGLPMPGAELKLVPFGDKYELRVRSEGVTPGYLGEPEKTREAFDEEGFFRMGDALRFADPNDPLQGLCFAGRVAEEFKLITGTWVSAGTLRADAIAAASPWVRDVVVCGLNESYVALLVWPNLNAASELAGSDDPAVICAHPDVREKIAEGFRIHNAANTGSSRTIRRFMLLAEPPDPGAYEITDKGYINQSAVQSHRRGAVEALFADILETNVVEP